MKKSYAIDTVIRQLYIMALMSKSKDVRILCERKKRGARVITAAWPDGFIRIYTLNPPGGYFNMTVGFKPNDELL